MTSLYPTQVHVDLNAIRHNFREVRRIVPENQRILCVVKSNAYGHGIEEVGAALVKEGADFFGVRDVSEGRALRKAGIKAPILILLGIIDDAFREIVQYQLTPVIYDLSRARAFNDYLELHQLSHPVHVKVDTGMTRIGVPVEQVPFFMGKLKELKQLRVEGLLSHLADATNETYTAQQKEAWDQVQQQLKDWDIAHWHLSNSIGAIQHLMPKNNLVRAGIVLYGAYPDPQLEGLIDLKPALKWQTEVLDLKSVPAGTAVSYGCTYTTQRPSLIAALPVGYADGYPRLISNRGHVLLHGKPAPIVGRVCMDLTMVDVTDIPEAKIGDVVTLIGKDGEAEILADEMATWAETISYEILARIAARVPRRYSSG